ncbi:MAG TPA: TetR/AcrR family transcriptional regulator [Solirubrobacterales bacterium]|nr:TetR/AcrR family transcriptional regulator [Solirubrobacterales bacterium]
MSKQTLETPTETPVVLFPGHGKRRARERLVEAVLTVSGERGYENIAVQDVIEAAKASRATFYKYFDDKEDCFAQAYTEAADWLYQRLAAVAGREPSWKEGLRAAVAELLEFCANQPAVARALFVEVHAAGGDALRHHEVLMERLSHAIDGARRENSSRQAPPPVTAAFMVGAIETLVRSKLMSDDPPETAPELLPGILHFVVMQFYGEDAAWEELTAAPIATWHSRREAATRIP